MSTPVGRTHLAFVLHMHQPLYVDPATGVALLPWVRLHGARAYHDIATLLDQAPHLRLTINVVPSLIEQLQAVAAGARDTWLELALRPAASWTAEERLFLLERFFSVQWSHGVEARPRYRELLDKRGRSFSALHPAAAAIVASFSDQELRDLTVLFHLAWLGFAARAGSRLVADLEARGRDYGDQDLAQVYEVERTCCQRVLPLLQRLAARGQIELSSTPRYHPIVPLLCDSEAARRAQPTLPLPDRFSWPDDARRQIREAREVHQRCFGAAPAGMWPAEGCLSPEALAAYHAEGVGWLASDEGNLFRSLPAGSPRGLLYQPFSHLGVDLVFRDRDLSDRVGFTYAHGTAEAGVADLVERVRRAGAAAADAGIERPLVAVILDGENPWEQYPDSGEPFLRALAAALAEGGSAADLATTAIGPFLAEQPGRHPLSQIHSGSWIDSDFHIWIGDPVKNRAWNLLGRARRRFQQAEDQVAGRPAAASAQLEAARAHLDAAEGSDWFWWFGEPFHSAEDGLFDALFRAHLAAAWRALGERPPEELDAPVGGFRQQAAVVPPRARIHPGIDGRVSTFYEWVGAGRLDVSRGAAMAEAPPIVHVHFGFDAEQLYLRLDPDPAQLGRLRAATIELTARTMDRVQHFLALPGAAQLAAVEDGTVGKLACDEVMEMALPYAAVGSSPGDRVELVMRMLEHDSAGSETVAARLPREGYLEVRLPDAAFDADHWFI